MSKLLSGDVSRMLGMRNGSHSGILTSPTALHYFSQLKSKVLGLQKIVSCPSRVKKLTLAKNETPIYIILQCFKFVVVNISNNKNCVSAKNGSIR